MRFVTIFTNFEFPQAGIFLNSRAIIWVLKRNVLKVVVCLLVEWIGFICLRTGTVGGLLRMR